MKLALDLSDFDSADALGPAVESLGFFRIQQVSLYVTLQKEGKDPAGRSTHSFERWPKFTDFREEIGT